MIENLGFLFGKIVGEKGDLPTFSGLGLGLGLILLIRNCLCTVSSSYSLTSLSPPTNFDWVGAKYEC